MSCRYGSTLVLVLLLPNPASAALHLWLSPPVAVADDAPAGRSDTARPSAPDAADENAPLTLRTALDLAAARHETTGIATARIAQATALRQQAIAQLVPSLLLTGTYTRRSREVTRVVGGEEITVQALNAENGTAVFDSTLFDARAIPGIRAANRSLAAVRLASAELERGLAFDVATSFFAALSAERLRGAASRRVEVAEANTRETRARLDAGLAARNELTRAELELATARLARTQGENLVRTTRLALGDLIAGDEAERPLATPTPLPVERRDPAALVALATEANAALRSAGERAAAARLAALTPKLGYVPTLAARGTYRSTNEAGLSGTAHDWNVALVLSWSLWDGGDNLALAKQLEAQWQEAELDLTRQRRRLAHDVERALADLATAAAALEQASVVADVARQNAEEVHERYRQGLATALEQADALVAQFEADSDLARQGFAHAQARLALSRAIGEWPPVDSSPNASEVPQ